MRADGLPAAPATTRPEPSPAPSRRRVLVIEDHRDSAETLRRLLSLQGYDVAVAHSGPEGIAEAGRRRPDVILCDIGLPGMDGYAVAAALRAAPGAATARLIALSGYGREEDVRRARESGFDDHVVKPANPDELIRKIENPHSWSTSRGAGIHPWASPA